MIEGPGAFSGAEPLPLRWETQAGLRWSDEPIDGQLLVGVPVEGVDPVQDSLAAYGPGLLDLSTGEVTALGDQPPDMQYGQALHLSEDVVVAVETELRPDGLSAPTPVPFLVRYDGTDERWRVELTEPPLDLGACTSESGEALLCVYPSSERSVRDAETGELLRTDDPDFTLSLQDRMLVSSTLVPSGGGGQTRETAVIDPLDLEQIDRYPDCALQYFTESYVLCEGRILDRQTTEVLEDDAPSLSSPTELPDGSVVASLDGGVTRIEAGMTGFLWRNVDIEGFPTIVGDHVLVRAAEQPILFLLDLETGETSDTGSVNWTPVDDVRVLGEEQTLLLADDGTIYAYDLTGVAQP